HEEAEAGQGEGPRYLGEDCAGDAQGGWRQGRRGPVRRPLVQPVGGHGLGLRCGGRVRRVLEADVQPRRGAVGVQAQDGRRRRLGGRGPADEPADGDGALPRRPRLQGYRKRGDGSQKCACPVRGGPGGGRPVRARRLPQGRQELEEEVVKSCFFFASRDGENIFGCAVWQCSRHRNSGRRRPSRRKSLLREMCAA
ncbi:unnamed protein product, partial [Ectocarpus sp. 12 AP-2014]